MVFIISPFKTKNMRCWLVSFSFCKENGQKGKFPRKTSRGKENRLSRCENVIHKRKILLEKYLGMLYNNDK